MIDLAHIAEPYIINNLAACRMNTYFGVFLQIQALRHRDLLDGALGGHAVRHGVAAAVGGAGLRVSVESVWISGGGGYVRNRWHAEGPGTQDAEAASEHAFSARMDSGGHEADAGDFGSERDLVEGACSVRIREGRIRSFGWLAKGGKNVGIDCERIGKESDQELVVNPTPFGDCRILFRRAEVFRPLREKGT